VAKKDITHEASASATGYLYQCRIALLLGLQSIPLNPDLMISVEKFDDVAFDTNGTTLGGTPGRLVVLNDHQGTFDQASRSNSCDLDRPAR
jgi:hypothetical protein